MRNKADHKEDISRVHFSEVLDPNNNLNYKLWLQI